MIIQKIEIENFRSYYGCNNFEFSNGLNLIIGANGDGKTTFYEALEWLFRTDEAIKTDSKFISRKRIEELFQDESDDVRVAMTYEHKGAVKTLEKRFHFTKSFDGEISMSNYTYCLLEGNGVERSPKEGIKFDVDLPSEIRKYTMFKGESDLDVFQSSNALKMLVETFSDVKDFETYFSFMKYATEKAEQARDNAQRLDKKNSEKIAQCKRTIEYEKGILSDIEREIQNKETEATNFESLLRNIEQSKETSQLLVNVNSRINNLEKMLSEKKACIDENYTINLLDDKWILMGFEDIAKEYSEKVSSFDLERRKIENEYIYRTAQENIIEDIKEGFTPLPETVPGPQYLKEMLEEEVCKVCGRPAAKHSDAWDFIRHRLEVFENSKKAKKETNIEPYYKNNYIVELQRRDTTINDNLEDITRMRHKVLEAIAFNNKRHEEIKRIEENLNDVLEEKKRILAQSEGLTEEQLVSSYENISKWFEQKNKAEQRLEDLKKKREQHRGILEESQNSLNKMAEGTTAASYARTANIIRKISEAFKTAKETNKKKLLRDIEDESNKFLEKLNLNDFKGTIRILEKANGQGEAVLTNDDGSRIFTPNTALRTTYLMSVLFAIGKLSSEKNETEFPLLFDAPTSSFTDSKESQFFNVISELDKQVIIVTKSFLKENIDGDSIIDDNKIREVNGRVFRIEKKKPFDDKKLGTIQTIISKVK